MLAGGPVGCLINLRRRKEHSIAKTKSGRLQRRRNLIEAMSHANT